MSEPHASRGSDDGAAGVELCAGAAQGRQLCAGRDGVPGLVQNLGAGGGDLVAADHHGLRMPGGDRLSLGQRQA